jgi:competence protein ComEC
MFSKKFAQLRNEIKVLFSLLTIKAPLLVVGLALLFGVFFAFHHPYVLLPAFLFFLCIPKEWFFPLVIVFLIPLPWLQHTYQFPQTQLSGEGTFRVSEIKELKGRGWICKGNVLSFQSNAKNVPVSFFLTTPPPKASLWKFEGELIPSHFPFYQIKKAKVLSSNGKTWLIPLRKNAKNYISKLLDRYYSDPLANAFVKALFLGEKEGRELTFYLRSCGLSHLAAISGFHFALLALFLYYGVGVFLPPKKRALFLLTMLTLYFLFIGPSPSIQRAWIFSLLALCGILLDREIHSLNLLGGALLFSLLLDPLSALQLGFQLSFLATAGLFLYMRPLERTLWTPPKAVKVVSYSLTTQGYYLFAHFFFSQIVVNLSINTIIFPFLLYQFHHFPLSSLLLNLIYPTLSALTLFLLLLGFIFPPFHTLNHSFTSIYLSLFEKAPLSLYEWSVLDFPSGLMACHLCIWGFFGLWLTFRKESIIVKECYGC